MISLKTIEEVAFELMKKASIEIPSDFRSGIENMADTEPEHLSEFVLRAMLENWDTAKADSRPMCADTGLPRYYIKAGNDAKIQGGFVGLENALRKATAAATSSIPLRPNRVHPIIRKDYNNNIGQHAPEVQYAFEPAGNWIDITTVHKGGLFGTDYRMLFPGDGIDGIKHFFLDVMVQFGRRGLFCQPAIVGIGLGGNKDTCMRLGKEACSLRVVGERNPDPEIAELENELTHLGNSIGMGPMGYVGKSMVVDCNIEIGFTHTGGMPISIHTFCLSSRRSTARVFPDKETEFRENPKWFTPYYRREGIE